MSYDRRAQGILMQKKNFQFWVSGVAESNKQARRFS